MKLAHIAAFCLAALLKLTALAAPVQVYPVRTAEYTQSLNGAWSFKYIPSLQAGNDAGFYAEGFDASGWKQIPVPANWELQGFAEPQYDLKLEDGLGLYRRNFRVPANWQGRRTYVRLDGVAFGYELWINGRKAGNSVASAFNPHTFDVTSLLNPHGDNLVALKVSTKPLGYEFDVNDDWSLSGIFRDVTLFSTPATYVEDLTTRTRVKNDGSAELSVNVKLNRQTGEVRGKLLSPAGALVKEFRLTPGQPALVPVAAAQLWSAETPSLYRLQLTLSNRGKTLQTIDERIGLREVKIVDGVLQLNGRPIKLRGVNHHDLEPETGRVVTDAGLRRDLALMKKANINYIRTSHYPPDQRLLALCDELGFYVVDEVAIGKGEEHLTDPAYRDNILARVTPTITRDKNHASVLIWSIGNENPITDAELEASRLAKQLDPTRPITIPKIGSYFAKNYEQLPDYVDIYAPHYPTNAMLRDYASKLKRPVLFTEYAHALGLATDRLQEQWEFMQAQPGFAGGSVWHFHDQGILRRASEAVDVAQPTKLVWLDPHRYYDTNGLDGTDGIVYADRTPQVDYWQLRKVYSPVQILERSASIGAGDVVLPLTIENRYDFRSLTGMRLEWALQRNGKPVTQGSIGLRAASHQRETVNLPLAIPADAAGDVLALALRCIDEQGNEIIDRVVRLDQAQRGAGRKPWWQAAPLAARPTVTDDGQTLRVTSAGWNLTVQRATGELTLRDRAGGLLIAGIYPHSGRKPTMAEALSVKDTGLWTMSTLRKLEAADVKLDDSGGQIRISVTGRYPRPDAPEQALTGGYHLTLAANGALEISYDFTPDKAQGMLSEAGLTVLAAPGFDQFRWIGQGPYAGYPGKDKLNEFGLYHLARNDLRFQGNRRDTELALLTTAAGNGLAVTMAAGDIAVERDGEQTLLSHNALIGGLGNKGIRAESRVQIDAVTHVSGTFTLTPLDSDWPAALVRLFGQPKPAPAPLQPFYHSYDQ